MLPLAMAAPTARKTRPPFLALYGGAEPVPQAPPPARDWLVGVGKNTERAEAFRKEPSSGEGAGRLPEIADAFRWVELWHGFDLAAI